MKGDVVKSSDGDRLRRSAAFLESGVPRMRRASPTRASTRCSTVARERGHRGDRRGQYREHRGVGPVSDVRGERARAASGPRRDRTQSLLTTGKPATERTTLVVNYRQGKPRSPTTEIWSTRSHCATRWRGRARSSRRRDTGDPSLIALVGHRDRADDPGGARALPGRLHVGSLAGEKLIGVRDTPGASGRSAQAPGRGPPCWPAKHAPSISWGRSGPGDRAGRDGGHRRKRGPIVPDLQGRAGARLRSSHLLLAPGQRRLRPERRLDSPELGSGWPKSTRPTPTS